MVYSGNGILFSNKKWWNADIGYKKILVYKIKNADFKQYILWDSIYVKLHNRKNKILRVEIRKVLISGIREKN